MRRTDVQRALAGEVVGQAVVPQDRPVIVLSGRHDPVAEVDRVVPGELRDAALLVLPVHRGSVVEGSLLPHACLREVRR